jgi:hypothetical protein
MASETTSADLLVKLRIAADRLLPFQEDRTPHHLKPALGARGL